MLIPTAPRPISCATEKSPVQYKVRVDIGKLQVVDVEDAEQVG